jgi:hypothetical protein
MRNVQRIWSRLFPYAALFLAGAPNGVFGSVGDDLAATGVARPRTIFLADQTRFRERTPSRAGSPRTARPYRSTKSHSSVRITSLSRIACAKTRITFTRTGSTRAIRLRHRRLPLA